MGVALTVAVAEFADAVSVAEVMKLVTLFEVRSSEIVGSAEMLWLIEDSVTVPLVFLPDAALSDEMLLRADVTTLETLPAWLPTEELEVLVSSVVGSELVAPLTIE